MLVVNKPINMLTQSDSTNEIDLLSAMKEYIRVTYNKPGNIYLGMVHRLDRVTGGIVVFAKTSKSASRLSNQIRLNTWKKKYLVIVDNKPKLESATLKDYLAKDSKTNNSRVVSKNSKNAKKAILHYKTLKTMSNKSLLEIDLVTGRSHQIRVQLASRNTPIFGDHRYNKNIKQNTQIKLFANQLEIEHPTLKEKMLFQIDPPKFGLWNKFY